MTVTMSKDGNLSQIRRGTLLLSLFGEGKPFVGVFIINQRLFLDENVYVLVCLFFI